MIPETKNCFVIFWLLVSLWQQFFWDTDGLLAYDRLSASWKDNYWPVLRRTQHSSYSMSSSRNSDESCHLGVCLFRENAPVHKSFVAQLALCNCEFVQLNHPAYSPDLAPSNHFLIRNLKYHLRGTLFIVDESLKIAVKA